MNSMCESCEYSFSVLRPSSVAKLRSLEERVAKIMHGLQSPQHLSEGQTKQPQRQANKGQSDKSKKDVRRRIKDVPVPLQLTT